MGALENRDALRMVTLFSGAVKGMAFYPASHPSIRQPMLELDKILAQVLGRAPEVSWGILDGAMFFEEHLFISPSTAIADMTNRMMEKDIGRIIVAAGLTFDELQNFIRLFSAKGVGFDALIERMRQEAIVHIRLLRQGEESFETPDEKQEEQNLGNRCRSAGNAAEPEDTGNDGNNEEYECIIKHGNLLCLDDGRTAISLYCSTQESPGLQLNLSA